MPECQRDGHRQARMGDPDSIDVLERLDTLGQSLSDQHRDFRLGGALIVPELGEPTVGKVLCPFGFPEDRSRSGHAMEDVAAVLSLGYSTDVIVREFLD